MFNLETRQVVSISFCIAFTSYLLYLQYAPPAPPASYGFDVRKVLSLNLATATRSWELGACAEALLELDNPELTVFAADPFPGGKLPQIVEDSRIEALKYIKPAIWTNGSELLCEGEGSSSDPASLGIFALLLSGLDAKYLEAAHRQTKHLLDRATRFPVTKGGNLRAISHRDEPPQLWGDFVYMVPPFLASYSVATGNLRYIKEAVRQCQMYRTVLVADVVLPSGEKCKGLWRHIVSHPPKLAERVCCSDHGVWLTANAWAMAGMVRVLETVVKWNATQVGSGEKGYESWRIESEQSLLGLLEEMLSCAMAQSRDSDTDLLKNYMDGKEEPSAARAFGDVAGTALMTSAVHRLAVLKPERFGTEWYLGWAENNYKNVADRVDRDGRAGPVTTPYEVPAKSSLPMSPEGQSMVVMMAAARRDCVQSGICQALPPPKLLNWDSGSTGEL